MKRFLGILFWLVLPLVAQVKLEPDAAGCVDSKVLPRLPNCRIDNCEAKDSDHRDVPVREDDNGEVVTAALDGESRTMMYECNEGTTPVSIVQRAATALRAAGFQIPYQFSEKEATLTARKSDLWVLVDAASRYYTVVEMKSSGPDFEGIADAASMAEAIERYGHMPVYGIRFLPGRADLLPASDSALREVAIMLEEHPQWRIRIEGHTDNTGSKMGNMTLSSRRASAVASWLAAHGIKRTRLDPQGLGDSQPVADNAAEAGRTRNRRIELVKLAQ